MKAISVLFFTCFASFSFAEDPVNYDEAVTFAQERCASTILKERAIYCLGPEKLDEIYFNDGKEEKKVARKARVFDSDKIKTVGDLIGGVSLSPNASYEVCVYRSDKKKLLVRVIGDCGELPGSQFLLKGGDLIVIQRHKGDDPFG